MPPPRAEASVSSRRIQSSRTLQDGRTPKPWMSYNNTRSMLVPETLLREDAVKDIFENFLKDSNKASRLSPLFNFQYGSQSLRKYEKQMVEIFRESENPRIQNGEFVVRIKKIKNLKSLDSEADAVSMRVASNALLSDKPIYQCVLCAINSSGFFNTPKNFVVLPLMLWRGNPVIKELVDNFLMQQFKCNIWPIVFRPVDLEWMTVMYAANEQHPSILQLTYGTGYTELRRIKYIIDGDTVNTMVRSVLDADSEELKYEQVVRVMKVFKKHFLGLTCIDLNHLHLQEIKTASLNISKRGFVRIKQHEQLLQILSFLTNIAESLLPCEEADVEQSTSY